MSNKTLPALKKIFLILFFIFHFSSCTRQVKENTFSFNLPVQIHNTDPQLTRGTASNFLFFNLHRGLLYYNSNNELTYFGAKSCIWKENLQLLCTLNQRKWSDGSEITSTHYLNSFKSILNSKNRNIEYLQNIKGFKKSLESNHNELGISTPTKETILFSFSKKDLSFISKLTHSVFVPRKENKLYSNPNEMLYSGPYKFFSLSNSRIKMINNPFYNNFKRPSVEALFVDESQAALNLYEAHKIDFLRFLPTHEIANFNKTKLFFKSSLSRLDGLVFSASLISDKNLRKALTHSLEFSVLKKIYKSDSTPGCPPLPDEYFKDNTPPCYLFDLKKANHFFKLAKKPIKKISLYIPKIESNDHLKMAEWAQDNWRKHLGLLVNIEQLEAKVLQATAKQNRIPIYRRGFNLQQLGCYQALENFKSTSASNFINLKSLEFDHKIQASTPKTISPSTCSQFFTEILDEYLWIPTGRLYFSHLHSTKYEGYTINDLNQFDLSKLRERAEVL